jgi:NTE family protein
MTGGALAGVPHISAPVRWLPTESPESKPSPGIALCLSGGGYRAMLFHLGAVWRLSELGLLSKLKRVSSVSGGSITAGVLGRQWKSLQFDAEGRASRGQFESLIVGSIRALASASIDVWSVAKGALPGQTVNGALAGYYRDYLFGNSTLQDLPEEPRFVINATNVQSGVLWRFSKPFMADWRVGLVKNPTVSLAVAVAASSAFPPILSPARLKLDQTMFEPGSGHDLQRLPFTTQVYLTDGGVYDNLGLETAWKKYQTVLVSDGGAALAPEPTPSWNWLLHTYRVLNIINNQIGSLRKRELIRPYELPPETSIHRDGTYWGIGSEIDSYPVPNAGSYVFNAQTCSPARTHELAATRTRLEALEASLQERLINWGYAICDVAMRVHLDPALPSATGFPYPTTGV